MSLRVLVSLKFPVTSCTYSYTKYLLLNGSLVMASGPSVRSFFTPAAKKCKYLEQTHQMADGIRPDQASMIKDSLDRGFCSMHNFVWTWQHFMFRLNQSFNIPPPPAFDFFENYPSNSLLPEPKCCSNAPHSRVHSADQMPPPRGHFKLSILSTL